MEGVAVTLVEGNLPGIVKARQLHVLLPTSLGLPLATGIRWNSAYLDNGFASMIVSPVSVVSNVLRLTG